MESSRVRAGYSFHFRFASREDLECANVRARARSATSFRANPLANPPHPPRSGDPDDAHRTDDDVCLYRLEKREEPACDPCRLFASSLFLHCSRNTSTDALCVLQGYSGVTGSPHPRQCNEAACTTYGKSAILAPIFAKRLHIFFF